MRKANGWKVFTVAMAIGLAACGGGDGDGGGDGGASRPIGDDAIQAADVVARTDATREPLDGVPSPDGTIIYYTASGDGPAAVFSVPSGGGAVTTIAEGAPLVKPSGIGVATDGSRVYVADQQALRAGAAGPAAGAILTLPATGTTTSPPTFLDGTDGRAPRGLDVVKQAGGDVIYFTGTDPANGAAGLFQVPAAGGTVATVAEGAPFVSPDSVVVNAQGDAFVTDQGAGAGHGLVFRVSGGNVTPVLDNLHLGSPAGVTLVRSDTTLLVSSIDAASRSDQVLFLDLATGETAAATKVIGANKDSAGGLHRAHDAAVLAWADVQRPGRVYRVEL